MIKLQQIELEGFSSVVARTTYRLDLPGINIISGENGAGKTTILNALSWVLFGKTIKKNSTINPWPALLDEHYQGTIVILTYTKNGIPRKITHCSKYLGKVNGAKGKDRLIFEIDGVIQETHRDKGDIKAAICDDIGFTFNLFKSTILFGQKVERILDVPGPERNLILEQAFEASFISLARKKVEDRIKDQETVKNTQENHISGLDTQLQIFNAQLKDQEASLRDFENTKITQINNYRLTIKSLKKENLCVKTKLPHLKKINTQLGELNESCTKYAMPMKGDLVSEELKLNLALNTIKSRYETAYANLKSKTKELWNLPTTCLMCKAPLDAAGVEKQKLKLKEAIRGFKSDVQYLKIDIDEKTQAYNKVCQRLSSFDKKREKLNTLKNKIKALEAEKKQHTIFTKDIQNNLSTIKTYKKLIRETKARELKVDIPATQLKIEQITRALQKEKRTLKEIQEALNLDYWLIKDPLSNRGLKSFIFDNMLKLTNQALQQYEPVIGLRIILGIQDNKRRDFYIRVFRYNEEVPHTDLSGGEKQLGDIAITLAIADSIKTSKDINCLFLDEVFESLDENNVGKVTEMLQTKAKDRSIHIITHLNTFAPSGARYVYVTKNKKGHTRIR